MVVISSAKKLEHRGVTFYVGRRDNGGIGWAIQFYSIFGMPHLKESMGAFYDEVPDHPEGAYAWAEAACRAAIDRHLNV